VEEYIQEELFSITVPEMSTSSQKPIGAAGNTSRNRARGVSSHTSRSRYALPENLPEFRVIRSGRRKRSIHAFRAGGIIEIHIPARTSRRDEYQLIPEMIAMVLARESRIRRGDDFLEARAHELLGEFLPEFHERPVAIQWRVMRERWGSCTTEDRTIRISERLNTAPAYVINYVLFHELIHLRIPGHDEEFQALLRRYPRKQEAEAFLEGYEAGAQAIPEEIQL
jgi:Protein of unknown function DUF45